MLEVVSFLSGQFAKPEVIEYQAGGCQWLRSLAVFFLAVNACLARKPPLWLRSWQRSLEGSRWWRVRLPAGQVGLQPICCRWPGLSFPSPRLLPCGLSVSRSF